MPRHLLVSRKALLPMVKFWMILTPKVRSVALRIPFHLHRSRQPACPHHRAPMHYNAKGAQTADEEDFLDNDGEGVEGEGEAEPAVPAATDWPEDATSSAHQHAGDPMDEDEEQARLPDMSNHRMTRHTDAVVSVGWSQTAPSLVASGSCDDKAFFWRLDKDGASTRPP